MTVSGSNSAIRDPQSAFLGIASGSKSAFRNPHSAFPLTALGSKSAIRNPHSAFLAGLGKTAAAILAWLWRRRFAGEQVRAQTPRRSRGLLDGGMTRLSAEEGFKSACCDAEATAVVRRQGRNSARGAESGAVCNGAAARRLRKMHKGAPQCYTTIFNWATNFGKSLDKRNCSCVGLSQLGRL